MVQVDVFFSYAMGSGFALAACRQLIKKREEGDGKPFDNTYFTRTLLFLAIFILPGNLTLLWGWPSWETMHVSTYASIPAWFITVFCLVSVGLGILGFWVTYQLLIRKRFYLAFLQMALGYFLLCFMLVNGWDKTGYQRFFSVTKEEFLSWQWSNATTFLTSGLFLAVVILFGIGGPLLFYWFTKWMKRGYAVSEDVNKVRAAHTGIIKIAALLLVGVLGSALAFAVIATLLIAYLGWILGVIVFIAVFCLAGLSRWGVYPFLQDQFLLEKEERRGEVVAEEALAAESR